MLPTDDFLIELFMMFILCIYNSSSNLLFSDYYIIIQVLKYIAIFRKKNILTYQIENI